MLARAVFPLAVLFILAACGGSKREEAPPTIGLRGEGFTVQVPRGWKVTRPPTGVAARHGAGFVSVSVFPLVKPYDPAKFGAAAKELDGVAARLAKEAGATLTRSETVTVGNRKVRSYSYGTSRIAFVLVGKREYQLFCAHTAAACDLLFSSFTLAGPQALQL